MFETTFWILSGKNGIFVKIFNSNWDWNWIRSKAKWKGKFKECYERLYYYSLFWLVFEIVSAKKRVGKKIQKYVSEMPSKTSLRHVSNQWSILIECHSFKAFLNCISWESFHSPIVTYMVLFKRNHWKWL